eukprot:213943-Chlamydomonas_euryale.AAC.1
MTAIVIPTIAPLSICIPGRTGGGRGEGTMSADAVMLYGSHVKQQVDRGGKRGGHGRGRADMQP